jgi:hypothetical protein
MKPGGPTRASPALHGQPVSAAKRHTAPELAFTHRSADANSPPRRRKIIGDLISYQDGRKSCAVIANKASKP